MLMCLVTGVGLSIALFGLLLCGEMAWGDPAQYISIETPETTAVIPNRESLL